ncbi:citrate lyase holo-[acyl-carrier protein] synthase [Carnobacterium pleistocenium]|uniref:citrate lyase holo-[acyl-carrier protein] synthase n=1 Tax=Carnobacterium pleistocenium TaxID=181073 RepID=UPI00055851F0|nr:citrate lyase holo-[acyl-carrier protein] synthase [Carnobacterium pleistocenium]
MMNENLFLEGSVPSLEEVLQTRENRAKLEQQLVKKFAMPLIAFKLNIPGPVKNNATIKRIFEEGCNQLQEELKKLNKPILYEKKLDLNTGPEYFCVQGKIEDAFSLKKMAVALEEKGLGRIYDIDILRNNGGQAVSIQRTELEIPVRKCFICATEAKDCSRNRTHSVLDLQLKLTEIVNEEIGM